MHLYYTRQPIQAMSTFASEAKMHVSVESHNAGRIEWMERSGRQRSNTKFQKDVIMYIMCMTYIIVMFLFLESTQPNQRSCLPRHNIHFQLLYDLLVTQERKIRLRRTLSAECQVSVNRFVVHGRRDLELFYERMIWLFLLYLNSNR